MLTSLIQQPYIWHTNNGMEFFNEQFHEPVQEIFKGLEKTKKSIRKRQEQKLRPLRQASTFCFVRSDLCCSIEEISMKWQKVFITQAARKQQWKDQGPFKKDTAVRKALNPGQWALAEKQVTQQSFVSLCIID